MVILMKNTKLKADEIFWIFENKFFKNDGNYNRTTNLILEFSEFIENSSKEELNKFIHLENDEEFYKLKQLINNGIDLWLDDGRLKTLLITPEITRE